MTYKILAKDNGETLLEHSLKVKRHALLSKSRHFTNNGIYGYLTDKNIELAALFHDIGKCTSYFQKRLKEKGNNHEDEKDNSRTKGKIPHQHSEVSYAFLKAYTILPDTVLKVIYWHHSITTNNFDINITDIIKQLSKSDIEVMISYVKEIDETLLRPREIKLGKTPIFFTEGESESPKDAEFLCGLSCLIMGDRIASGMPDNDDLILNKQTKTPIYQNPYPSNERTLAQVEISSKTDRAFIVNAPTGFGKTTIALQWAINNPRKTIVVCPMNNITNSVFKNLNNEIKDSKSNLSNSLVLANGVVDSFNTTKSPAMMETDITTMNIDSFLNGSVKYEGVWLLLNLLHSDVIFDEYHELFSKTKIPAIFTRIMKARLWYTKAKTMFLSATPIDISLYIDQENEIPVYPEVGKNYDQIHDIPYKVNFIESIDIKNVNNDSITIYNSIPDAQEHAIESKLPKLSHYAFIEEDKKRHISEIYKDYGKGTDPNIPKTGVVGTSVLRTSMNVSFNEMTEVVQSPIATIQTIGRCNRFSEREQPIFNIYKGKSGSNTSVIKNVYSNKLEKIWYQTLFNAFGDKETFTLKDLYEVYHAFNKDNYNLIDDYYSDLLTNSERGIKYIYPKKPYTGEKSEEKVLVSGSNPLRSTLGNNEYFIVCKDENGEYIDTPINHTMYNEKKDPEYMLFGYKNENDFVKYQVEFLGEVNAKGPNNYDFSFARPTSKVKTPSFTAYINNANKSSSPIYAMNFVYSKTYGLIKK